MEIEVLLEYEIFNYLTEKVFEVRVKILVKLRVDIIEVLRIQNLYLSSIVLKAVPSAVSLSKFYEIAHRPTSDAYK